MSLAWIFALALIAVSKSPCASSTRRADVAIECADLARNGLGGDRRLDGAAVGVTQHHQRARAKNRDAVFDAGDRLRRRQIAGHAVDEHMSDALVEHDLDRHAGIRAGQDRGERLLLLRCLAFQDREVLPIESQLLVDVTLVAVHQRLERRVGRQLALRDARLQRGELDAGAREDSRRGTAQAAAQHAPARRTQADFIVARARRRDIAGRP